MRAVLAVMCVLGGCGRHGFDALGADDASAGAGRDSASDALDLGPCTPFQTETTEDAIGDRTGLAWTSSGLLVTRVAGGTFGAAFATGSTLGTFAAIAPSARVSFCGVTVAPTDGGYLFGWADPGGHVVHTDASLVPSAPETRDGCVHVSRGPNGLAVVWPDASSMLRFERRDASGMPLDVTTTSLSTYPLALTVTPRGFALLGSDVSGYTLYDLDASGSVTASVPLGTGDHFVMADVDGGQVVIWGQGNSLVFLHRDASGVVVDGPRVIDTFTNGPSPQLGVGWTGDRYAVGLASSNATAIELELREYDTSGAPIGAPILIRTQPTGGASPYGWGGPRVLGGPGRIVTAFELFVSGVVAPTIVLTQTCE